MREIKFRAWDGENMMCNLDSINLEELRLGVFSEDGETHKPATYMQYTGLKDKNGKEIYEGDIVKVNNRSSLYEVVWETSGAYFRVKSQLSDSGFAFHVLDQYNDRLEVIGNIYENPELLAPQEAKTEEAK
jgi:uncharacterized phage protein (TIGR01671 family)